MFPNTAGGKKFSKLVLAEPCLQMEANSSNYAYQFVRTYKIMA